MAFLKQSLIILSTIGLIIISRSFLINAAIPLTGILILLYIIFSKLRKNNNFNLFFLIILIILLVLTTGSASSPLFFLIYFLSFGIAFVFDPKATFVFTAGLIVLLFPEALKADLTKNLTMLFSIIFLSPIAYFFGKSFQKNRENNRKIEAMRKINKITIKSLLLFVVCYLLLVTAPSAQGQTMLNDSYIIQTENLDTASNNSSSTKPINKSDSTAKEGVNFKITTNSVLSFSASLSSDFIDFGILTPTNPIIRTTELNIYSLGAYGYSLLASQNHPLQKPASDGGNFIPDTTCDNGSCNEKIASEWINTLTYGFGYRCDNITGYDCNNSFTKANLYRQLSDNSQTEIFESIMAGIGSTNKNIRLSYKINISGTQSQGIYSNTITYIAVPSF
ncbi:MAG: hypothetical protein Q8P26_04610 [Candidatus Levybacteria bacterium]|nr:hypothetical protein [Candidatus Levybacteria bacterium]